MRNNILHIQRWNQNGKDIQQLGKNWSVLHSFFSIRIRKNILNWVFSLGMFGNILNFKNKTSLNTLFNILNFILRKSSLVEKKSKNILNLFVKFWGLFIYGKRKNRLFQRCNPV